ncbi:MAG TPA: ABC transporter substrate-binding protein [bacterium]|nr:ABC transporter substrate-binding protein [bacterium]
MRDRGVTRRKFLTSTGIGLAGLSTFGLSVLQGGSRSSGTPAYGAPADVEWWISVRGGPEYASTDQSLVSQFNASQSQYKVNWNAIPSGGSNTWYEKLGTAIASGTQPDAVAGTAYMPWQYNAIGQTSILDDVVAELKAEGKINDFVPGVLDLMKFNGHYVCLPSGYDIRVPYYRKDILDKNGLKAPKTWDDLMRLGAALKKQNIYLYAFASGQFGWQQMMAFVFNNGGGLFDKQRNVAVISERNLEAATFISEMVKQKYISPNSPGMSKDDATKAFAEGQAVIYINQPALPATLPNLAGKLDLLDPTAGPHGDKGTLYWVNNCFSFSKSKSPAGGKAWIKWWAVNNGPLFWQGHAQQLPVRKSVGANAYFNSDISKRLITEWLPIGRTMGTHYPTLFPQLNSVEGEGELAVLVNDLLSGKDPKQALQTAQRSIETIMKRTA